LENVADGAEFGMAVDELIEDQGNFIVRERHPTDNTFDEIVLFGELEEPLGFFNGLAGLNGNGAGDAGGDHFFVQVGRKEVVAEDVHAVADPGVLLGVKVPEMVMRVYAVRHLDFRGGRRATWWS
jgi:hypothetical protein